MLGSLSIPKYLVLNKKGKHIIDKYLKKQIQNGDHQEISMYKNIIF